MNDLTRIFITVAAILLAIAFPVWTVWMIRRHCVKKDAATKHRRTETMMVRLLALAFLGVVIMPFCAFIVIHELNRGAMSILGALLTLIIGSAVTAFFVCLGTRQIIIYDYDRLRYRPAFGRMRTYDFSEVRSMKPIVADLLVHVGRRWILIDAMQGWQPLRENYLSWRLRHGLPVKKRTYKTALGRAFGAIPGGMGILAGFAFFLVGGGAVLLVFSILAWKDGEIWPAVFFLLFAAATVAFFALILFAAANQEKCPRLAKTMLGDMKQWGKPRWMRTQPEKEKKRPGGEEENEQKKT